MSVHLFDPNFAEDADWPINCPIEKAYITQVATAGVPQMVENVRTEWRALRSDDRVFPVTINYGEYDDSYVCLPHSAYILYGRQELDFVDMGAWTPVLKSLIGWADGFLRRADINRIIHIDNWLLSTNLHGDWSGEDLADIREYMTKKYPNHILAVRSVDDWSCPALLKSAKSDGWVLLPSRQIWVTDDMEQWQRKNSTRNDRRLLRKSPLDMGPITSLNDGDAARIADLYHQLYIGKYSPLNPVFTADYVNATFETGLFHYQGARTKDGMLMAVCGSFERAGVMTPPVVGYDMERPVSEGLYRVACYLFSQHAREQGYRLNGSAGASQFKKHRGATSIIEYSATYINHLPLRRRAVIRLLAFILNRLAVPIMRKKEL